MALARSEGSPQRFYSMSAQIRLERNAYYDVLEATQKGSLDITTWLEWFLDCIDKGMLVREPGGGRSTSYTLNSQLAKPLC